MPWRVEQSPDLSSIHTKRNRKSDKNGDNKRQEWNGEDERTSWKSTKNRFFSSNFIHAVRSKPRGKTWGQGKGRLSEQGDNQFFLFLHSFLFLHDDDDDDGGGDDHDDFTCDLPGEQRSDEVPEVAGHTRSNRICKCLHQCKRHSLTEKQNKKKRKRMRR